MDEKRYALIIANYEFEDKNLQKLTAPAQDAQDLATILKTPDIGGFDQITTLINEPSQVIEKAITELFSKKLPQDLLLLYYSGHGVLDQRGRLYLTTRDTEHDLLRATALSATFITDEMDDSRSKRQVLILDCCYSGAFAKGIKATIGTSVGVSNYFEGSGYGRVILTATDTTQYAWEGDQVIGDAKNSLFTHYLIEGIRTGKANPNSKWITIDALYEYAYERVLSRQTPLKWSSKQAGEIVIARNPELHAYKATPHKEFTGTIVGLDFGTTASAIAVIKDGKPFIIHNRRGEKFTPSVVAFSQNGEVVIGTPAVAQAASNPERTIFSIKTKLGTDWQIDINGVVYTAVDIAALILQNLRKDAESFLEQAVKQAVVTTPAYFNMKQRQALTDAAAKAGFEVLRVVAEPTAASLAHEIRNDQVIAVCDLGGGTFDVSIIDYGNTATWDRLSPFYEVRSVSGDTHLGGDDFDARIVGYLIEDFKKKHQIDLSLDKTARIRLKQAAEQAKIALSELEIVNIHVPYIYADQNGVKHILADLTRSRFEDLVRDLVARIVNACKAAVRDSNNAGDVEKIDELVLVGLSTKIPSIRRALVEYFKKQPKPRIDPEEAVVLGAAVQAGVLSGDIVDLLLMDATPLTLGVETLGGVVNSIIERNTSIPCKKSQFFTTVVDNQTKARIHILQGERPMAKDNESLGSFIFSNISLAPKGTPQLEITLDIDADSVLTVQVLDKGTGRTEHRQLKYTSRGYGLEDKATLTDQTPDLKDEIVDIARWEMPGVDLANLKVPPIQNNS